MALKGAHVVPLLDRIGVDLVCLGNHEFDFGPEQLGALVASSRFRWLCANALQASDGALLPGVLPSVVLTFRHYFCARGGGGGGHTCAVTPSAAAPTHCSFPHCPRAAPSSSSSSSATVSKSASSSFPFDSFVDLRVGVFGVVTRATPFLSNPTAAVRFEDEIAHARACIDALRGTDGGADIIVALTHQSLDEDVALARALPAIALVLGGHEHVPFAQMEGGALIFKTGQNAQWLGAVRTLFFALGFVRFEKFNLDDSLF